MAPTRSLHVAGEKLYADRTKHLRSELAPGKGGITGGTGGECG